jgi:hypothetical protein
MWIHSKFNHVSGLPYFLIHISDRELACNRIIGGQLYVACLVLRLCEMMRLHAVRGCPRTA